MPQRFLVDRGGLVTYLALTLTACRGMPGMLVPAGAAPVSRQQVGQWVTATVPTEHRLHKFKWLFQDERSSAGGRGSARIAPPDSLRFDAAGPFGSGAGAAAFVGDTPLWAEPPDAVKKLVPNYPLMWAMFGVASMPENGAELRGLTTGTTTAWQYASPSDTIEYARTTGDPVRFVAVVRQNGKLVGRAETELDSAGAPLRSRLTVPSAPAQLDLTFLSTKRTSFAPDLWLPRRP
jgi:hypothetical protein